jgi:hypothetical protein
VVQVPPLRIEGEFGLDLLAELLDAPGHSLFLAPRGEISSVEAHAGDEMSMNR